MAIEAQKLGFSALVITDHFYPTYPDEWCSAGSERHRLIRRASDEVKEIMPVIIGMELAFGGEEMLVFGTAIINTIHIHCQKGNSLSVDLLKDWKSKMPSAFVLCHPQYSENWPALMPILDGYERYNSGQDMFKGREFNCLHSLPAWCNSDAHTKKTLYLGYNITEEKIETEFDLIEYIKSGKQPQFHYEDRNV